MAAHETWLLLAVGFFLGSPALVAGTLYGYGSSISTKMTISEDAPVCIDGPSVRILQSPASSWTGSPSIICISPNGGVAFEENAFPVPFAAFPTGKPAILPFYLNYSPFASFDEDAAKTGVFYEMITSQADLAPFVADITACGLATYSFEPFWALIVTWGNLQADDNFDLFESPPTTSNTFQLVVLGNSGDALFAIINYEVVSFTTVSGAVGEHKFHGSSSSFTIPYIASVNGGNCAATVPGRSVYMISNPTVVQPGGSYPCTDGTDCGTYFPFHTGTAGAASGSCSGTECVCNSGYTGIYCLNDDTNSCDPDPCDAAHSLLCEDTGLGADVDDTDRYMCHCDVGYEGDLCADEILACDSNPCTNGGTCVDIPLDFMCTCPPTWTGTTCETDVDECATAPPCLNGATCVNTLGSFECQCDVGYTGTLCECGDWAEWSTKCQTDDGWDGICGGCGTQFTTRVCESGDGPFFKTRSCNVRSCQKSVPRELVQKKYRVNADGTTVTVIRPRRCCYKFPASGARRLGRERQCSYILNGIV